MLEAASQSWVQMLGLVSSLTLPLFNIPLILRLLQRKSSEDLSLTWVLGVFFCLVGIVPVSLESPDAIFKWYSIFNLAFFAIVTWLVVYYRLRRKKT